jgi:UDP-glucose 4-epimerase
MKQKILVTGAAGFVGSHWVKRLLDEGHKVTGIDIKRFDISLKNVKNFKFLKASVFDYELLEKLIKKHDIICHFAGVAEPMQYLKRTKYTIQLTLMPSLKIIDFCSKYKKKIIFTSTSEIYGKLNKVPFKENSDRFLGSPQTNRWCYSTSKSLVEHYINACSKENDLKFIIFRLFNVFGPGLKGRVVDEFINKSLLNKKIMINGNGQQTRSFLYIDDCINAFYQILKKNKNNQVYNVGSDNEISMIKLAKRIKKICNSKSQIIFNSKKFTKIGGYEDISRRVPSVDKLKKQMKWKPKINLDKGLQIMKDHIQKNI